MSRVPVRQLRELCSADADKLSDRDLVARFAADHDEEAFAAVVRRHGPMVLNACRRLLRHEQDVEDAFQAVFLVLARRAGTVNWQESIAGWLHIVACRVAGEYRGKSARLRSREKQVADMPDAPDPAPANPDSEPANALDQELAALPEKYRLPLVLCCLEGLSRDEAAARLGWSEGKLKGNLERGREELRRRLTRRGVPLGLGLAPLLLPNPVNAAIPAPQAARLATSAAAFAAGREVASAATALAVRTLAGMGSSGGRLLLVTVVVAVVIGVGSAAAALGDRRAPAPPAPPVPLAAPAPVRAETEPRLTRTLTHGNTIRSVAVSADGRLFASASLDGTAKLWDRVAGKERHTWKVEDGMCSAVALSPDAKFVAAGTSDGELVVWDADSGQEVWGRLTRKANVYALTFSPDGSLIASADHKGTVSVWDSKTGANRARLVGHEGRVWTVAFTPDGTTLASGGDDGFVRTWDVASGRRLDGPPIYPTAVSAVAFTSDGKRLAYGGATGKRAQVWVRGGEKIATEIDTGAPHTLVFSADGRILYSANRDGTLSASDAVSGVRQRTWDAHRGPALGLALSRDGRWLISSGNDGTVRVWDLGERR
jgi:RNA polymerase sigma factor (sigma-70 family)